MKKILIADDNEDIIDILSNYIEREGYETVVAMDGEEALQLFEKEQPVLVLLDIMMPKIDGYKALASIRDAERKLGTPRDKRCKVIMISALDEGFDASYASDDYEEYMCKPIDIMKFDSLIRKLEII
mgnify:CR=1 FL=1